MYTIDASVWINAADPREVGYAASRAVLQALRQRATPLILPTLVLAEVAAAVRRIRDDAGLALAIVVDLRHLPALTLVPLTLGGAQRAAALATQHRLRGADAVYAAVALRAATTLISRDNEHLTRLAGIVQVQTPEQVLDDLSTTP